MLSDEFADPNELLTFIRVSPNQVFYAPDELSPPVVRECWLGVKNDDPRLDNVSAGGVLTFQSMARAVSHLDSRYPAKSDYYRLGVPISCVDARVCSSKAIIEPFTSFRSAQAASDTYRRRSKRRYTSKNANLPRGMGSSDRINPRLSYHRDEYTYLLVVLTLPLFNNSQKVEYEFAGINDPEGDYARGATAAGPVLLADCAGGCYAYRQELFPPADGYYTSAVWSRETITHVTGGSWIYLEHNQKKARRLSKTAPTDRRRPAVLLFDDVTWFTNDLFSDCRYLLRPHRQYFVSHGCSGALDSLAHILELHEALFGRYSYRHSSSYPWFVHKVSTTADRTFKKWSAFPGFIDWLKVELNSAPAKAALREAKKTQTEPSPPTSYGYWSSRCNDIKARLLRKYRGRQLFTEQRCFITSQALKEAKLEKEEARRQQAVSDETIDNAVTEVRESGTAGGSEVVGTQEEKEENQEQCPLCTAEADSADHSD